MSRLSRPKKCVFQPSRPNFGISQFSRPHFGIFRLFRPIFGMFRLSRLTKKVLDFFDPVHLCFDFFHQFDLFRLSRPKMGIFRLSQLFRQTKKNFLAIVGCGCSEKLFKNFFGFSLSFLLIHF